MAKGKKTGGRIAGTPNKASAEVKAIALKYGPAAIKQAAKLAGLVGDGKGGAESEQARLTALGMVLDRAYGKPSQAIVGDQNNPIQLSHKIEVVVVDPAKG